MKIYQRLINEWKQDSLIDPLNLTYEASTKLANLHAKYLNEYWEASALVTDTKQKLDDVELILNRYFTGKMTKEEMDIKGWPYNPFGGAVKPLKTEMQKYIENHPDYKKANTDYEDAKTYKEIVKYIVDDIKFRGNKLNLILENEKFRAGM